MTTSCVTGATGFIGGRLVRQLLRRGDDVVCLVRASSNREPLLAMAADLPGTLRFAVGDVLDEDSLATAVQGVDVVFHLAAMLKAPWHADFLRTNAEGTGHVAKACAGRSTPPVLVAVSSIAAAGPSPEGRARREDDPAAPISRYGHSKRNGELAAEAYAAQVPTTLVRPPVVFGPHDTASLPLFLGAARGIQLVPTLAESTMSMVFVDDLAWAIAAAGAKGERLPPTPSAQPGVGVYFAAHDEQPTVAQVGRDIGAALGRDVRVLRVPSWLTLGVGAAGEALARLRDQPSIVNHDKTVEATAGSWTCSAAKAHRDLGFAPPRSLRERLGETALWYQEQGWLR